MATKNLIKQSGLWTNVNTQGSYPEGAMLEASNVVIDKTDIVESRRGFQVYGEDLGQIGSRAKQLLNFSDTLMRHYSDVLEFETSTSGDFSPYQELNWKYAATGELTSTGATASFTSLKPHGLLNTDTVVISGATPTTYNGAFAISVVDDYTFEYTMTGAAASPASGDAVMETSSAHIDQVDEFNRIRGVETPNGNYYFTSDTGVKKLDKVNNFIRQAGAAKGLDVQLEAVEVENAEVLPQDSQVAYRMLWGYKDLNGNLIIGTPSTRTVIGISTASLVVPNFNELLVKLDAAATVNTGILKDTDYGTLAIATTSSASALNAALKTLAAKLEVDMSYITPNNARYGRVFNINTTSTGSVVTITTINPHQLVTGDLITVADSNAVPSIDGQYVITATGASTLTINVQTPVTVAGSTTGTVTSGIAQKYTLPLTNEDSDYVNQQDFFDEIVDLLLSEPLANIDANAQTVGNFEISDTAKTVKITFTIPDGISPNDFYQIYRTAPSIGSAVDPGDEMGLVYESNPTAEEIMLGFIEVIDNTPDDFRGANLYTNPNQETILQSNEPAPFAKDLAVFRNILFFANTKVRHKFQLNLLGTNNLVGTKLNIGGITYTFDTSEDVDNGIAQVYTTGTPGQNLDDTARSLIKVINRYAANTQVYAYYLSQADQVPGQMLLEARNLNEDTFYALSNSTLVGTGNFNPTIAPESNPITAITAGPNPTYTTSNTHNLSVGDKVILVGTNNGTDGVYPVDAVTNNSFTIIRLVSSAIGTTGAFKKASAALGVSDNETVKNRLFYSKLNQFEAVPIVNYFDVGSGDKDIVRILPLRDSLFVLKTDGVYRVTGDTPSNLSVSLFDNTTNIIGSDTASVGNNQIHTFSTQGVVVISDTGVQIISQGIENTLLPLTPNENIQTMGWSVFYQTDRKYILSIPANEEDDSSTIMYIYNNITNAWTIWNMSKTCGVVNTRDDRLYMGASDINSIEKERKDFMRSDFADREYALSITEWNSVTNVVRLTSAINAAVGDVLLQTLVYTNGPYGNFEYEVEAIIVAKNSITGEITVNTVYPFELGAVTLYKAYECKVRWEPDTINDQAGLKHYREAILRFRKSRITKPILGFSSDLQPSINEVELIGVGPGLGNWGYFPWGGVAWGGDANQRGFRTYIPIGKQRCSMLNVYFRQFRAREQWQLEGLALVFEMSSPRINR